jgi:hypothetical protein
MNAMIAPDKHPRPPELTPEQIRSRRARNVAIGLAIAALCVIFYAVTVVKLGPGVLHKPV